LKSLVNDWLSSIERDLQLLVSSNSKPEILKQKKKQLKNTLQLLTYIDSYNANYRLLLETFCLTTF
jgi:cell shape-determining protein MreC